MAIGIQNEIPGGPNQACENLTVRGQLNAANGGGGGPSAQNYIVTNYTATGAEGTDFNVTLSTPMLNDRYALMWSPVDLVGGFPAVALPNAAAGDRTTTQFKVLTGNQLPAGTILAFVAFAQP